MQEADPATRAALSAELDALKQHWLATASALQNRRVQFTEVLQEWEHMDDVMEDVLFWLKEMRLALDSDLPTNYDDLQRALKQCQVINL